VCKIYRVRPYSPTVTAELPDFRVQSSWPFETTGVDFALPDHEERRRQMLYPYLHLCRF
jgi:hypothetical protein